MRHWGLKCDVWRVYSLACEIIKLRKLCQYAKNIFWKILSLSLIWWGKGRTWELFIFPSFFIPQQWKLKLSLISDTCFGRWFVFCSMTFLGWNFTKNIFSLISSAGFIILSWFFLQSLLKSSDGETSITLRLSTKMFERFFFILITIIESKRRSWYQLEEVMA